uniref:Uncharacterized protein n=1 Tax=Arundo donax TaxID=35708 RepID=A0A0A8YTD8_ARUDO
MCLPTYRQATSSSRLSLLSQFPLQYNTMVKNVINI